MVTSLLRGTPIRGVFDNGEEKRFLRPLGVTV